MNFFMLPVQSYNQLTGDDIISIDDIVSTIKELDDTFSIPVEFYSQKDNCDIDFADILNKDYQNRHDEMEFLIELVCKNKQSDSSYEILKDEAKNQTDYREEYIGFVGLQNLLDSEIQKYIAYDDSSLRKVYRFIASTFSEYFDLCLWWKRCYPRIIYTNDVFNGCLKMGAYSENYEEINKCLSILNDEGLELFLSETEDYAISALQTLSGVRCSGKGSNEASTFKKKVLYISENKETIECEISCIPHFKLDGAYSNKRIHFSWGREGLLNHKIIVVHIGEHWCQQNEKKAEIIY